MNSVFADDKTRRAKIEVTAAQLETDAADFKDGLDQEKRNYISGELTLIRDSLTSGNPKWVKRAAKRAIKLSSEPNIHIKTMVIQSDMFPVLQEFPNKLPFLRVILGLTGNNDDTICQALLDTLPLVFETTLVQTDNSDKISVQILINCLRASPFMRACLYSSPVFAMIRRICDSNHKLAVFQFLSGFTSELTRTVNADADQKNIPNLPHPAWVDDHRLSLLYSGRGRIVDPESDLWYCIIFFCSSNDGVAIRNGISTLCVLAEEPVMADAIIRRTRVFEAFNEMWMRQNDELRSETVRLIAEIGYTLGQNSNELFVRTGILKMLVGFCKEMANQGELDKRTPLMALKCLSMYLPFNPDIIGSDIDGKFIESLLKYFPVYGFAAAEEIMWFVMNLAIVRPDALKPLFDSPEWIERIVDFLQSGGSHISNVILSALDAFFAYEAPSAPISKTIFEEQNGPETVAQMLEMFDATTFNRAKEFLSHFAI